MYKAALMALAVVVTAGLGGCFLWEEEGDCTYTCSDGFQSTVTVEDESECYSYCINVCDTCSAYRYEETGW